MGTWLLIRVGVVLTLLVLSKWGVPILLRSRSFREKVGRDAFARLPMHIRLQPGAPLDATGQASAAGFRDRGFQDAGSFVIPELPDVQLALLVKPDEAMYAVVYQHARAGSWIELISNYSDGENLTYTAIEKSPPVDRRPQQKVVHAPRFQPGALYARFRSERRKDALTPVTVENVTAQFEAAWAANMKWRSERGGITENEVARVAAARR